MADNYQASAPDQLGEPEPEWSAEEAAESAAAEVAAIIAQDTEMGASWAYIRSDFPHGISAQAPPLPGQDPAAQASLHRQHPARSRAR